MFTPPRRQWLADKLGDLGTYTIGALLLGQVLTGQFRFGPTIVGLIVSTGCYLYGSHLLKSLT